MWRIATSETMNRGHAEFDGPGHNRACEISVWSAENRHSRARALPPSTSSRPSDPRMQLGKLLP
jgi:hypothetical protein